MPTVVALVAVSWLLGAFATAAAAEKVILVSPLPFGVDVYLNMTRQGTLAGARSVGAAVAIFESSDPETRSENIRAALNYGATIIVAPGPEFVDIVPDFAEDNPRVKFLMLEDCTAKLSRNTYCVLLRTYEAGFLAGVEAGLSSVSGKVGAIAPVDYPEAHRFTDTFADGARYARPGIEVHPVLWIGGDNPWSDPLRAQSQAAVMLGDGVDRILATVAAGNGGIYKMVSGSPGALATGLDVNECPDAPGHILDSAVRHVDQVMIRAIEGIVRGTQPNTVSYGLKEGAVNLTGLEPGAADSKCVVASDPAVLKRLAQVRDQIIAGQIVVADPAGVIH
ncbi:MAG TPA: BMP family ABC transporter substrate-binding protein [Steroidobacteraceae bacterium]|jgi:basic membrane protein A|nr:BMP family ABC transporter substrate-binding protein [Steroidobacteraceae bacterium]